MCVVSMVHDHFGKTFPDMQLYISPNTNPPAVTTTTTWPSFDLVELRGLIKEFRELVAAAKRIDEVTGQPDCVDPVKAQLEQRVEKLEKLIANPPELVLASGRMLPAGKYRIIDGKLYQVIA